MTVATHDGMRLTSHCVRNCAVCFHGVSCCKCVCAVLLLAGTVRRFCEHFMDDVDRVAFVVNSSVDEGIYLELLPLYFPRSAQEEMYATMQLPEDTGNEWGESVIAERQIRIATIPGMAASGALDSPASSNVLQHTLFSDLIVLQPCGLMCAQARLILLAQVVPPPLPACLCTISRKTSSLAA
jgi:hypothetical protein